MFRISYGKGDKWIDVDTDVFKTKDGYCIPKGDLKRRNMIGTDPIRGTIKEIKITDVHGTNVVPSDKTITFILDEQTIKLIEIKETAKPTTNKPYLKALSGKFSGKTIDKLNEIHNSVKLSRNPQQELPEQAFSVEFIKPDSTVLEFGGNIGRNTTIISKILQEGNGRLVTLETLKKEADTLKKLCKNNGFNHVQIVNGALSKQKLIQNAWTCKPWDGTSPIPDKYVKINTVTLEQLRSMVGDKPFDTLVVDCEGAFYYIIKEFPELLNDANMILIENDSRNAEHCKYIDETLTQQGFKSVKTLPLESKNAKTFPMRDKFYEAWMK